MIDYKRIQELDLRYDEIISGANLELRQINRTGGRGAKRSQKRITRN